jgi:DNA-binding MarR family transcriptional regulator
VGRGLRDVWAHFNAELAAGARGRYPDSTTASNQVMLLIDGEGSRVSELARRAQVTKQTMAQAVELLEGHGLVVRRPDPTDGRAKLVVLTAAGWDAIRHGLDVALAIHDRWTELLGQRDMLRLVELLDRLADALDDDRRTTGRRARRGRRQSGEPTTAERP